MAKKKEKGKKSGEKKKVTVINVVVIQKKEKLGLEDLNKFDLKIQPGDSFSNHAITEQLTLADESVDPQIIEFEGKKTTVLNCTPEMARRVAKEIKGDNRHNYLIFYKEKGNKEDPWKDLSKIL